jgi:hypothetical protein
MFKRLINKIKAARLYHYYVVCNFISETGNGTCSFKIIRKSPLETMQDLEVLKRQAIAQFASENVTDVIIINFLRLKG